MLLWELFCGSDDPSTGRRVLRPDLPRKPAAAVESLVCVLPTLALSVHSAAAPPHCSSAASVQLPTETWGSGFLLGAFLLDAHL